MIKFSISLNTISETHVMNRTWIVDEETYRRFEDAMMGDPEAEQMVPFELVDDMLADGRHIAL